MEEANSLLPTLTRLLIKLQDALRLFEGQRAEAIEAIRRARGNGHAEEEPDMDGLELVRDIVGEIEGYGCIIKGFEDPLIDFPSLHEGEEVYLCWRLGESEVQAWHPLDAGFAGRRPL